MRPCGRDADEYIAPRLRGVFRPLAPLAGKGPAVAGFPAPAQCGEMAEWSKAHAWKVCKLSKVS